MRGKGSGKGGRERWKGEEEGREGRGRKGRRKG